MNRKIFFAIAALSCAIVAHAQLTRGVILGSVQDPSGAVIGAGTVNNPVLVRRAAEAGAQFLISPGSTDALLDAMDASGLPYLPGAATASEVMRLIERGHPEMKFFPAEASGGHAVLRSLASPLPEARFCPTGGITLASAPIYLALPNVGCIGGTWITPLDAIELGDWTRIEGLARQAAELRH